MNLTRRLKQLTETGVSKFDAETRPLVRAANVISMIAIGISVANALVCSGGKYDRLTALCITDHIESIRQADGFTAAIVLFADMVGFTEPVSRTRPDELVRILNCFYIL